MREILPSQFLPRRACAGLLIATLALLAGCGGGSAADSTHSGSDAAEETRAESASEPEAPAVPTFAGEYPIRIVATIGMVADLARNIGGEHVTVTALMGEGIDPHLYKASPGDVRTLREADLVLFSGLHLEGKMAEMLEQLARQQPVYAVTDSIAREQLRAPPEFAGNYDPHVWFDVTLWTEAARHIAHLLSQFDPPHAGDYQANMATLETRLLQLDQWVREQISTIPADRRVMITAHDAFNYFGRAYAIEVLAIQGISTESEAGVAKINQLVETIVKRGVKAVFVETSVSDKNISALIEGARARGHQVRIGGSLFSDAMGKDGTPEGTYEGMVRQNVNTVVGALK